MAIVNIFVIASFFIKSRTYGSCEAPLSTKLSYFGQLVIPSV